VGKKYTLITGASRGIGRSLAKECAQRGMNLALVSLPHEELIEVGEWLSGCYDVDVRCLEIDLVEPGAPSRVYKWCMNLSLDINILINNAGIGYEGCFDDYEPEFYEHLIRLNTIVPTLLIREFLPMLSAQRQAWILNCGSMAAFFPVPFKAVYASSKSYITQFSNALQKELHQQHITVSVLCPAGVDSFAASSKRIERIGWVARIGRKTPEQVARHAMDGLLKGKRKIIPGYANQFFYYITRLFPVRLLAQIIYVKLRPFYQTSKKAVPAHSLRETSNVH
jgi:uncharacterized protein